MPSHAQPMFRWSCDAARLMAEHPPRVRHPNKQAVLRLACPQGFTARGTVTCSRWQAMPLPAMLDLSVKTEVAGRPDVYDYRPTPLAGTAMEWHVNFADPHLFVAYGSGLFAQDEIQVAEHPVLGSLREALEAAGHPARTAERGQPTPVLVRGAERRVAVATDPSAAEGRPLGLYGNRFAAASVEAVERATKLIDPPTVSNLIAMAAPTGGPGAYKRQEIDCILRTAFTGFAAARIESREALGESAQVVIHSGFWGCGAFGGNRVLMTLLQVLAAKLARIDRLVFHAVDKAGLATVAEAERCLASEAGQGQEADVEGVLWGLVAHGFAWGVSDGN